MKNDLHKRLETLECAVVETQKKSSALQIDVIAQSKAMHFLLRAITATHPQPCQLRDFLQADTDTWAGLSAASSLQDIPAYRHAVQEYVQQWVQMLDARCAQQGQGKAS